MPTLEEVILTNKEILIKAGTPERFKLREKHLLKCQIDKINGYIISEALIYSEGSRNAHLGSTSINSISVYNILESASSALYLMASTQCFTDGNRRTALFTAKSILDKFSLGYLLALENDSDHSVARALNQVVDKNINKEEYFSIF